MQGIINHSFYQSLQPHFTTIAAEGIALTLTTLYEARHSSMYPESQTSFQNYAVPFALFAGIGFCCRLSLTSSLATAFALTAVKTLILSKFTFPTVQTPPQTPPAKEISLDELELHSNTTVVEGFEQDERYVEFNLTLADKDETARSNAPVEFVFCIDTSGSMRGSRNQKVKTVLSGLLNKIEKELKQRSSQSISLSFVTFDRDAKVLQSKVEVTLANIETLKELAKNIRDDGRGTNIMAGLNLATEQLTQGHSPAATANLIFLTDGESQVDPSQLQQAQQQWLGIHANLLAIGIGKGHNAGLMQGLITEGGDQPAPLVNSFYNYVPDDTSSGGISLEEAVNTIYHQALTQTIQSVALEIKSRDVKVLNTSQNEQGKYLLGGLSFGQSLVKTLQFAPTASGQVPTSISYTVTIKTGTQEHTLERSLDLTRVTEEQEVRKNALLQLLVQAQQQMLRIADPSQLMHLYNEMEGKVSATDFKDDPDVKEQLGDLKALYQGDGLSFQSTTRYTTQTCARRFNHGPD